MKIAYSQNFSGFQFKVYKLYITMCIGIAP